MSEPLIEKCEEKQTGLQHLSDQGLSGSSSCVDKDIEYARKLHESLNGPGSSAQFSTSINSNNCGTKPSHAVAGRHGSETAADPELGLSATDSVRRADAYNYD